MPEKFIRNIFYYKNYHLDFFETLKPEVKKKFNWTLQLIATIDKVPEKYFKHITSSVGIFEIKVEVGSDIYSFLFFRQRKAGNISKRLPKENAEDTKERNRIGRKT